MQNIRAEARLGTRDLAADLEFFARLGFRLDRIWPADDPRVAQLSGLGLRLRLERGEGPAGTLGILADDPVLIAGGAAELVAPGGARVVIGPLDPPVVQPPTAHAFVVRRLADGAAWVVGRAGMHYRDLVPGRLGGAMIASHIRIPQGGPVPDMVHFHKVGFQLIFCLRGWVDVVYEDQGPPIRLTPGDCVIQPPEIRHRVLAASDGLEVVEIGVPAEHVTVIDHDLALPTPELRPGREWQGQRFVHSIGAAGIWGAHRVAGLIARDTGVAAATGGVAGVQVVRKGQGPVPFSTHDADILFGFVKDGSAMLEADGQRAHPLSAGDAFVIPPGLATRLDAVGADFELIEVALPGRFSTQLRAAAGDAAGPAAAG
jgi:quercetin dioxygenase-like cupin family protein